MYVYSIIHVSRFAACTYSCNLLLACLLCCFRFSYCSLTSGAPYWAQTSDHELLCQQNYKQ